MLVFIFNVDRLHTSCKTKAPSWGHPLRNLARKGCKVLKILKSIPSPPKTARRWSKLPLGMISDQVGPIPTQRRPIQPAQVVSILATWRGWCLRGAPTFAEVQRISLNFTEFHWISLIVADFHWISLDFEGGAYDFRFLFFFGFFIIILLIF